MLRLNIGCGNDYREGYVNVDRSDAAKCDLIVNLEEGKLPYEDESVDYILCNHVLEHINNLIPLMNEFHRIIKPDGILHIEVPRAGSISHWKDPTHVRGFVRQTFKYFAEWNTCAFYGVESWKITRYEEYDDHATDENSYLLCEMTK